MIDLDKLEAIARSRAHLKVKTVDDLKLFLEIWWSRKYNLPPNHHLFQERTLEEHYIDFATNRFLDDPEEMDAQTPTAEELEDNEEWYKEKLGDQYREEYDYLIPPSSDELGVTEDIPEEVDEDFEDIEEDFLGED